MSGLLDQVAAEVAHLPDGHVRSLLPVLAEAERELKRDLEAWLRKSPANDASFTAQHYRQALLQLQGSMAAIKRLEPAMYRALVDGAGHAGELAGKHLREVVEKGQLTYQGSVTPLPIHEAAILAKGDTAIWKRYPSSAKRYAGEVGEDLRRQLAIGVARNMTHSQLVDRLLGLGGKKGLTSSASEPGQVASKIAQAMSARGRWHAERLVRTELMGAYGAHARNLVEASKAIDPDFTMRWDARADSRLCALCRSLDGQVAGKDGKFPGGYEHTPAHPCCRCACTPWHADWAGDTHADRSLDERPMAPVAAAAPRVVTPSALPPVPAPVPRPAAIKPESRTPSTRFDDSVMRYAASPTVDARTLAEFGASAESKLGVRLDESTLRRTFAVPDGARLRFTDAKVTGGQYKMHAMIEDADGRPMAALERAFYRDGKDLVVYHSHLFVHSKFQNTYEGAPRISDTVNRSAFAAYPKLGITRAEVFAVDVGRYAWARLGFTPEQMPAIRARWADHLKAAGVPASEMRHVLAATEEPWNLANFVYNGEKTGKRFMLTEPSWSGQMEISDDSPGYKNACKKLGIRRRRTAR